MNRKAFEFLWQLIDLGENGQLLRVAAVLVENVQDEAPGEEKGAGEAALVHARHDDSGRQ